MLPFKDSLHSKKPIPVIISLGIKPCFPCAHSGMNKFTPLISLGNKTEKNYPGVESLYCYCNNSTEANIPV